MRLFVLFFIFMIGCSNTDVNDSAKKSIKLSYILDMKNRILVAIQVMMSQELEF